MAVACGVGGVVAGVLISDHARRLLARLGVWAGVSGRKRVSLVLSDDEQHSLANALHDEGPHSDEEMDESDCPPARTARSASMSPELEARLRGAEARRKNSFEPIFDKEGTQDKEDIVPAVAISAPSPNSSRNPSPRTSVRLRRDRARTGSGSAPPPRSRSMSTFAAGKTQIELASHSVRAMLQSEREDFRQAETVLYVTKQVTSDDVLVEVERVVSPSEELHASFKRVGRRSASDRRNSWCPSAALSASASTRGSNASAQSPHVGATCDVAERDVTEDLPLPTFLSIQPAPPLDRTPLSTPAVHACLAHASEWDFDVFELERLTGGHGLVALCAHLLAPPCAALGVDVARLHPFLCALEAAYRSDVTYHTSTHAADVVHGTAWLLRAHMVPDAHYSPLLELALIIAAAAHDAAHPGVNADFLMKTGDPLALLYNDKSILESMHASVCFRLLSVTENGALDDLEPGARNQLRAWTISSILATDMKGHYPMMGRLAEADPWRTSSELGDEELSFALGLVLHAADLCGPIKPSVVVRFSRRVAEEFFLQGDREKALGLPVTDGFDRVTSMERWPQRNVAFIDFIVKPLYDALHTAAPDMDMTACQEGLVAAKAALDEADWAMPID